MNLTACFPGKYIQGQGTIELLQQLIEKFGSRALIITSPSARKHIPCNLLSNKDLSIIYNFGGECSETELNKVSDIIKMENAEVIVAMGGGKVIDTGKIAADRSSKPVIVVPTIASTDAPCSGCAVTYTNNGEFEKVHYQKLNPAIVLVDTKIIASAPVRFLISGMGDALATWFEARSCANTDSANECGGLSTMAGQAIARLCYETLLENGARAIKEYSKINITPALERIIEANILLSGIGFESGGLASAHAIHNGLTALPETHDYFHGEKVAFGVLAGLFISGADQQEIEQVYNFCSAVGLPVKLSDLGISRKDHEKLMIVAQKTSEPGSSIHHETIAITPQIIKDAILNADELGRKIHLSSFFTCA